MSSVQNKKWISVMMMAVTLLSSLSTPASAQAPSSASASSVFANPVFMLLMFVIILLFIVIIVFSSVLKASAVNKAAQEKKNSEGMSCSIKVMAAVILLTGFSQQSFGQAAVNAVPQVNTYWGLGSTVFFLLTGTIVIELIIAYVLYSFSMRMLGISRRKTVAVETIKVKKPSFLEKINASKAVEEEAEIMLDHNYDGIRELDNDLPPWWRYGFYFTIIFAVVYMIYYHGTHSGKLQLAEYEDQLAQAKTEMEEYRKKAADLVDENNVTVLTDASAITSGKNIFSENCAACHGRAGEGGVGPNLTDEYWLHKGDIKDIFRTIKYGWPEKGMKAWQQDLGAKQINEVASYILSLKGSNPPNAKEKQGELYTVGSADSTSAAKTDSSQIAGLQK